MNVVNDKLAHELTMIYIQLPDKAFNVDIPESLLKLYNETKNKLESLLAIRPSESSVKNSKKPGVINHGIDF